MELLLCVIKIICSFIFFIGFFINKEILFLVLSIANAIFAYNECAKYSKKQKEKSYINASDDNSEKES